MSRLFALPALLAALPLLVMAGEPLYSWKDSSGKIHYSDSAPSGPDVRDVRRLGRSVIPPADPNAERSAAARELEQRKKEKDEREQAAKAEQAAAQAEKKRDLCAKAQGRLTAIETGAVRFMINEKGERVALHGDSREAELASARQDAEKLCN